jgi:hypothetical protein
MDFMTRETGDYGPETGENYEKNETEGLSRNNNAEELDLLPEDCRYKDEGCQYAKSCLSCPFPQCLYDEPGGRQRWLKGMRNQEINRLFTEGWNVQELAMLFGVSQRTIQRAVKAYNREQVTS